MALWFAIIDTEHFLNLWALRVCRPLRRSTIAIEVAIYRMGKTGPDQKSQKNGKENGKWPHA